MICVQIGNSDDKLTQKEWSEFVADVGTLISQNAISIHFCGGSDYDSPWQNCCWVFDLREDNVEQLRRSLSDIRYKFKQDSVAWMEASPEFI